jgi:hypothetical protein
MAAIAATATKMTMMMITRRLNSLASSLCSPHDLFLRAVRGKK